jgi:hypothetical protein
LKSVFSNDVSLTFVGILNLQVSELRVNCKSQVAW